MPRKMSQFPINCDVMDTKVFFELFERNGSMFTSQVDNCKGEITIKDFKRKRCNNLWQHIFDVHNELYNKMREKAIATKPVKKIWNYFPRKEGRSGRKEGEKNRRIKEWKEPTKCRSSRFLITVKHY